MRRDRHAFLRKDITQQRQFLKEWQGVKTRQLWKSECPGPGQNLLVGVCHSCAYLIPLTFWFCTTTCAGKPSITPERLLPCKHILAGVSHSNKRNPSDIPGTLCINNPLGTTLWVVNYNSCRKTHLKFTRIPSFWIRTDWSDPAKSVANACIDDSEQAASLQWDYWSCISKQKDTVLCINYACFIC